MSSEVQFSYFHTADSAPSPTENLGYANVIITVSVCLSVCPLAYLNNQNITQFLANVNSRSRSLYAISRPSVVCLLSVVCLSVTLVHPTQAVELFRKFFFTIR